MQNLIINSSSRKKSNLTVTYRLNMFLFLFSLSYSHFNNTMLVDYKLSEKLSLYIIIIHVLFFVNSTLPAVKHPATCTSINL